MARITVRSEYDLNLTEDELVALQEAVRAATQFLPNVSLSGILWENLLEDLTRYDLP